jgi:[protein-PII] uridylyltransferase
MALASEDPLWALWACELAQRYGLDFSESLQREMEALSSRRPPIHETGLAGEIMARILASPRGVYPILQRMADLGILEWLIPEVGQTLSLIPYDPSHDYTVGQHTLYLLRHLDSLRSPAASEETNDLRRILTDLPNPEQLYMAALLHDAGKADESRPHSEVGEDMAKTVCERLNWDETAASNVCFLVRHHLLMAETSRLRDLNLEETIRDFTSVVNDLDRLNMLYLLTYADTHAVGAGVWTQVKGRFLRELYRKAERAVAGEEGEELDDASLARARRRLLRELSVENIPPEEIAQHVEGMPATYLLNTSLDEMALHIGFARRAREGIPVVEFHDERDSTFTEVTVCTRDDPRPGLLSKIAGVLYATDVDVHSAQVFTRVAHPDSDGNGAEERIAIDSLYVDFKGRRLTPGKRREISTSLSAVLTGQASVQEILTRKRRPAEIGGTVQHLSVRNDLSENFTVIEVGSTDERAMLYRASGALSSLGWGIHSARVSHFRGKSMAGFYVTGIKGLSEREALRALSAIMPLEDGRRPTADGSDPA